MSLMNSNKRTKTLPTAMKNWFFSLSAAKNWMLPNQIYIFVRWLKIIYDTQWKSSKRGELLNNQIILK